MVTNAILYRNGTRPFGLSECVLKNHHRSESFLISKCMFLPFAGQRQNPTLLLRETAATSERHGYCGSGRDEGSEGYAMPEEAQSGTR